MASNEQSSSSESAPSMIAGHAKVSLSTGPSPYLPTLTPHSSHKAPSPRPSATRPASRRSRPGCRRCEKPRSVNCLPPPPRFSSSPLHLTPLANARQSRTPHPPDHRPRAASSARWRTWRARRQAARAWRRRARRGRRRRMGPGSGARRGVGLARLG